MRGRFAPSPTGALHVGNLRTALVSWLSARSQGGEWIVRMEDLDPVTSSTARERQQLADLAAIGLVPDRDVVRQSDRFDLHREAVDELDRRGLVYPCFCTRREIREAASAPHDDLVADGAYPGTCRHLAGRDRVRLQREGRKPALRLLTHGERVSVVDRIAVSVVGMVDDVVLVRNDGIPAYNLAVVVDDHLQGVTEVVRGDDLLSSTPRQVHLQQLLGFTTPQYAHVPLAVGPDGDRLAKRHGAATVADCRDRGLHADALLSTIGAGLGLCKSNENVSAREMIARFSFDGLPREPWTFSV